MTALTGKPVPGATRLQPCSLAARHATAAGEAMPPLEQLILAMTEHLAAAGWDVAPDGPIPEKSLPDLIPPPDAVVILRAAGTDVLAQAALHFAHSGREVSYSCLLHLPDGTVSSQRGYIDMAASEAKPSESHGAFTAIEVLEAMARAQRATLYKPKAPPAPPVEDSAEAASAETLVATSAETLVATSTETLVATSAETLVATNAETLVATSAETVGAASAVHPLLAEVLDGIAARGSHTRQWADLRRGVFPGPDGWAGLKSWCAGRSLECEINFGGSSKTAEVIFRRTRAAARA